MEAACGEEQGKRDGQGDDDGTPDASEEEEEHDRDENKSLCEVVEDGVGGVANELAPVVEGEDLHAPGQDLFVQLLHFILDALDRFVERGPFTHEHDA